MKVAFAPINRCADVPADTNLLDVMRGIDLPVRSVCRGRGICATCQVTVRSHPEALTPRTLQETRTLALIAGVTSATRLSCQCRVIGDGLAVELPKGLYVERFADLLDLVGDTAETDYLHPITGAVMIPQGKIITRSQLQLFKTLNDDIGRIRS